jgi:hypothetical protein
MEFWQDLGLSGTLGEPQGPAGRPEADEGDEGVVGVDWLVATKPGSHHNPNLQSSRDSFSTTHTHTITFSVKTTMVN